MEFSGLAELARKALGWLLAFTYAILISTSITGYVFMDKFFEPQLYFASLEKHGMYGQMQGVLVSLFSQQFPSEIRQDAAAEIGKAVTEDYAREQSHQLIASFLSYLSGRSDQLELELDIFPIRESFAQSPRLEMKLLSMAMPSSLDLAQQMRQSGQMETLAGVRGQIVQAYGLLWYGFIISGVLLVLIFALQFDLWKGAAECCKALFGCGISTLLGGAGTAFLSPAMMGAALSSGASGVSPELAKAVSLVLGDVMYEVGILTILFSLPLLAIGFAGPLALSALQGKVEQKKKQKAEKPPAPPPSLPGSMSSYK